MKSNRKPPKNRLMVTYTGSTAFATYMLGLTAATKYASTMPIMSVM